MPQQQSPEQGNASIIHGAITHNAMPTKIRSVFIINTGIANMASLEASFRRLGIATVRTLNPDDVINASHVVLPGVGAFAAGMEELHRHSLVDAIRERRSLNRPLLAVCLGMQLLCDSSQESTDTGADRNAETNAQSNAQTNLGATSGIRGLSLFNTNVIRFPSHVRIPHFGWNQVEVSAGAKFLKPGYAYFANSYHLASAPCPTTSPQTVTIAAHTNHGDISFVSALECGSLLACQFHPELSGAWGEDLIARWYSETSASTGSNNIIEQ